MGQTQKSGWSLPTSVVPLKADVQRAARQVRFVPILLQKSVAAMELVGYSAKGDRF
jgi:hypothetical protein